MGRRSLSPLANRSADTSGVSAATSPMMQKRLSPEELKNLGNRLAKPVAPPKDPGPLHAPKTMPKQQVAESIDRLYQMSIARKENNLKAACERKEKQDRPLTFPKLTHDDMDESVDRLYKRGLNHQQKHMEAIKKKHEFCPMTPADRMDAVRHSSMGGRRSVSPGGRRSPSPAPKIDRGAVVNRLYTEEFTRKEATEKAQYDKYIRSTEPKMAKRTEQEIADYVERLYTGKKE